MRATALTSRASRVSRPLRHSAPLAVLGLLLAATAVHAEALGPTPVRFASPAQFGPAGDESGLEWVQLVFAPSTTGARFRVDVPSPTASTDWTVAQGRVDQSGVTYQEQGRPVPVSEDNPGPLLLDLEFAPGAWGSLWVLADATSLRFTDARGELAAPSADSNIVPAQAGVPRVEYLSHDEAIFPSIRLEHLPGDAAMVASVEAQGLRSIQWHNATVTCQSTGSRACPDGARTEEAGSGRNAVYVKHFREVEAGGGTGGGTLSGGGNPLAFVAGGREPRLAVQGSMRLPLAEVAACGAGCSQAPNQTVVLSGEPALEGLSADGGRLHARLGGSADAMRLDEQAVDPAILSPRAVAVTAAGALGLALLLKLAGPLFTRIRTPAALDHPRRKAIHEAVARRPGMSYRQLLAETGISNGPLRHHLAILKALGLVETQGLGRTLRHYPKGTQAADHGGLALLQDPLCRGILDLLARKPVASQGDLLATAPGTPRSTLQLRLRELEREGLVRSGRNGRRREYSLVPGRMSRLDQPALAMA